MSIEDKIKAWLDSKDKNKFDKTKVKSALNPFKESKDQLKEDFDDFEGSESLQEKLEKLVYSLDPDSLTDDQLMLRDEIVGMLETSGGEDIEVPLEMEDEFEDEPEEVDPETLPAEEMVNKYESKNVCSKCGKPQKENTEDNPKFCQGHSILNKKK